MRSKFPGYYSPSQKDFETLWKDGVFVFDTNVLLDLYRYPGGTVDTLLKIMESIKERIWIPYQISKEYHLLLNGIIAGQVGKYEQSINNLKIFKKQIDEKRNHPFLDEKDILEIDNFCKKFEKEKQNSESIIGEVGS